MSNEKMKSGFFAMADQALVSVVNATAGLLLIQFGQKVEYAIFALLFASVMLIQAIHRSLIISPYITLVNQAEDRVFHRQSVAALSFLACGVITIFAVLVFWSTTLISDFEFTATGVISFMLAVFGILLRESVRAIFYADKKPRSAFLNNLRFSVVSFFALLVMFQYAELSSHSVLSVLGAAGLISSFPTLVRMVQFDVDYMKQCKRYFLELFKSGRWALQGAVITWVNTSSYNYIVTLLFGALALADIAASRLFWMPMGLIIAGWSSIFRPYISNWYGSKEEILTKRLLYSSAIVGVFVLAIYTACVQQFYGLLLKFGFIEAYGNIENYLLLWGCVFYLSFLRSALSAALMVSEGGFKILSRISLAGLGVLILSVPYLGYMGINYVLIVLMAIEVVQLIACLIFLRKFMLKESNTEIRSVPE